jgi:hypothetical protein
MNSKLIESNFASETTSPTKKRAARSASSAAAGAIVRPLKKRALRTKNATECTSTPLEALVLDEIAGMNSAEFVESELNLPSALPNGIGYYQVSLVSNEALLDLVEPRTPRHGAVPSSFPAASSLLALKTGLAPALCDKSKEDTGNTPVCLQSTLTTCPTISSGWVYPRPEQQNENAIPRFTYPPPPAPVFVPKVKVETPSPLSYRSQSYYYDHKCVLKYTPSKDILPNHSTVMKAVHFNTYPSPKKVMCSNLNQARVAMRASCEIKASPLTCTKNVPLFSPIQSNGTQ